MSDPDPALHDAANAKCTGMVQRVSLNSPGIESWLVSEISSQLSQHHEQLRNVLDALHQSLGNIESSLSWFNRGSKLPSSGTGNRPKSSPPLPNAEAALALPHETRCLLPRARKQGFLPPASPCVSPPAVTQVISAGPAASARCNPQYQSEGAELPDMLPPRQAPLPCPSHQRNSVSFSPEIYCQLAPSTDSDTRQGVSSRSFSGERSAQFSTMKSYASSNESHWDIQWVSSQTDSVNGRTKDNSDARNPAAYVRPDIAADLREELAILQRAIVSSAASISEPSNEAFRGSYFSSPSLTQFTSMKAKLDNGQVPMGFNNMLRKRRQTADQQAQKDFEEAKERSRQPEAGDSVGNPRAPVRRAVPTHQLDLIFAAVLVLHALFIGITVEYRMIANSSEIPLFLEIINDTFTVLFTVELMLRFAGDGCEMFSIKGGRDWKWNWFDLLVVFVSLVELVVAHSLDPDSQGSTSIDSVAGELSTVNMFRTLRLVRLLRIIRIVRLLKPLRVLVTAICKTLKSVFWALLLMAILLYGFAIVFTQAVGDIIIDSDIRDDALSLYFGSLPRTMFTLFKSSCNGMSWQDAAYALSDVSQAYVVLFIVFVAFVYFAVLNVVTGLFCQSAIDSAAQDKEDAIESQLTEKQRYIDMLSELFDGLDAKEDGRITIDEFEEEINTDNSRIYGLFKMLDIDIDDAWRLFNLLDADGDGAVTPKEFMDGCLSMRGNAKGIHIAQLMYENKWMMTCLKHLMECVHEQATRNAANAQQHKRMIALAVRAAGAAERAAVVVSDSEASKASSPQNHQ